MLWEGYRSGFVADWNPDRLPNGQKYSTVSEIFPPRYSWFFYIKWRTPGAPIPGGTLSRPNRFRLANWILGNAGRFSLLQNN